MLLVSALAEMKKNPDFTGFFLVSLSGYEYPQLFITKVFQLIASTSQATFLDLSAAPISQTKAHFEMSFLGERRVYILQHFTSLDAASKKIWKNYLSSYQGPHTLIIFDSLGPLRSKRAPTKQWVNTSNSMVIELPDQVNAVLYRELFHFFYPTIQVDSYFITQLFARTKTLTLEEATRMIDYQIVVGRNSDLFFRDWFSKLVIPQASLFTLSQHFFARQSRLFFQHWKACKDDFPIEFWIAYWSEQIWQAAQFVSAAHQKSSEKKTFRLPFSFIHTDWRKHSLASLQGAHDELYSLDYALKNGSPSYGLEVWYHTFFDHQ